MTTTADAAGKIQIGDLTVNRLGFGAMRITGPGIWGSPADPDSARAVLRRAVELDIDFIDTADSYGPFVSEDLIREALHPYGDTVIATKGGLTRHGPDEWRQVGRPEYLRQCVEMSLRRLGMDAIPLWQLHRIDGQVPREEQFGVIAEMQDEGKIRNVGLSQVSVEEITAAGEHFEVVSVQNLFNLTTRADDDVVAYCGGAGIAFIPWFPIAASELAKGSGPLAEVTAETGATAAQVSLAWLLQTSPVIVPIPGTSSVAHLEENTAAAGLKLTDDQMTRLDDMAG